MGSAQDNAALDEIQFSNPAVLQYWQGVHPNSVHGYFSESPFFDHTTKNGVLWGQAMNDPNTLMLYSDRQRLEATLRQRPGTEYMIVGDPKPVQDQSQGLDTGVYVIRKQDRVKRPPREDQLTTLGTYYVAGQNIYQSPSVYDVVGNHLLSAMTSLSKFMDQAAPLPIFNPATGYTWFPPTASKSSKAPSTTFSREGSVGPDQSASQRATSAEPSARSSSAIGATNTQADFDPRDALLLEHSLRLALAHGDEYMDENPLRGEPGNFVFTHTKDHLRARQAQAEAAAAKAKEKEAAEKAKAAVPAAFSTKMKDDTPAPVPGAKRKGSKADGKKRRKSKAATSPTSTSVVGTPSAMASPEA